MRRDWVQANRRNGFEAGIKRLLTDLYPDNAHFIYELLQNAENAHAQEVRFILHNDRIEFEHDGNKFFSIQDVNAITSIGFSTNGTTPPTSENSVLASRRSLPTRTRPKSNQANFISEFGTWWCRNGTV